MPKKTPRTIAVVSSVDLFMFDLSPYPKVGGDMVVPLMPVDLDVGHGKTG